MMAQEEVVKPFDNSNVRCTDCDRVVCNLIPSQWGEGQGDPVCIPCERLREHNYGLPPSNATEPGLFDPLGE